MENEEGYMALDFRQNRTPSRLCQTSIQSSPPCPRWHRTALGLESAGILILTAAVIVMAVWSFQGPHQGETGATSNVTKTKDVTQRTGNGQAHSAALENSFSHLKQSLCDPAPKSSAEAFRCKLCPVDWLSHGRKCYWVSKEIKDWKGSQEDCTAKRSQMLMIQDWNEMEFIGSATQGPCWIGLHFSSPERKWTWLNNSSFDAKLFPVAGPAKENSCGMIKGSQIRSEICSADFKWICQKDGVFL